MAELNPLVIDRALYEKPILKTVIMDNFANQEEPRPLNEFRECVMDQSRAYLKAFFDQKGQVITDEEIDEFERIYYGTA